MDRLLVERARQRLSLQELADRSGLDAHTISDIERGRRKPRAATIAKLAEALGLEPEDLLEKESPPSFNDWLKTQHPDRAFQEIEALKRVLDGERPEAHFAREGTDAVPAVEQLIAHLEEYAGELRRLSGTRT